MRSFLFLSLAFCGPAYAACPGVLPSGVECVEPAATKTISNYSPCLKITNGHAAGKSLMVPVNSQIEWDTFRTHLPSGVTSAACGPTVIVLTGSGSWTVPADWNNANNLLEAIGGGGGSKASVTANQRKGGGGGAYMKSPNKVLVPGTIYSYSVGAAGVGGASPTAGGDTSLGSILVAKGGGAATSSAVGAGGLASGGTGDGGRNGGDGGTSFGSGSVCAGGGGAGGPDGNGGAGGAAYISGGNASGGGGANGGAVGGTATGSAHGAGGNNHASTGGGAAGGGAGSNGGGGGGGGATGGAGSQDSIWTDSTTLIAYGPGGGGGGSASGTGGDGGGYGSAGGPGSTAAGASQPGLIVITYTP